MCRQEPPGGRRRQALQTEGASTAVATSPHPMWGGSPLYGGAASCPVQMRAGGALKQQHRVCVHACYAACPARPKADFAVHSPCMVGRAGHWQASPQPWMASPAPPCPALLCSSHPLFLLLSPHPLPPLTLPTPPAVRCSWAVPAQVVLVLQCTLYNHRTCTASALQHPSARWLTGRAFWVLDTQRLTPLQLPMHGAVDDVAQCATVLTFMQLCFSLLLPAVVQASVECRMFARHQRERAQRRLPPERGWHTALYGACWEALAPGGRNGPPLVFLWACLSLAWDASLMLSVHLPMLAS